MRLDIQSLNRQVTYLNIGTSVCSSQKNLISVVESNSIKYNFKQRIIGDLFDIICLEQTGSNSEKLI